MAAYVVLHHRIDPSDSMPGRETHFDWMFDNGRSLWTWATEPLPNVETVGPVPAIRLADHRRDYLEYQGTLTGNRGEVSRVEAGDFVLVTDSDECFQFLVQGVRCGVLTFQRVEAAESAERSDSLWNWTFLPTLNDAS